jgi:hypothetical protein
MISKHWHWLDDAVMPLTLALLRVTALWLWLPLLERWFIPAYYEAAEVPLLPIWLMLALLLGGTVTTHLSLDLIHSLPQARRVVAVVGVAALFFALWLRFYRDLYPLWDIAWLRTWGRELIRWQGQLPPAYLALPLMAYLWLRGILDGSRRLEHQDVVNAFGLGTTGLVCLLLLAALDQSPLPPATGSVLFLFFATAMAGLSLAGLKKARLPSRSDGVVEGLRLNRYWLGSAASVIILILGIGFLLSLILAPDIVLDILRWSWIILSQVLILAIKLVSLVLYPIFPYHAQWVELTRVAL